MRTAIDVETGLLVGLGGLLQLGAAVVTVLAWRLGWNRPPGVALAACAGGASIPLSLLARIMLRGVVS